jgi:site-specific DNA-methyltransferase (adenine-specific)
LKSGANMKPYFQTELGTLYHADCREVLPDIEPVDLVLTDPPYGLGDKWQGGKKEWPLHHGQMDWDSSIIGEFEKIIEKGNFKIVWGGHLYNLPKSRCWLIWDKIERNDKFTSGQAEMAWTNLDKPIKVYRQNSIVVVNEGKRHPTQKPIGLIKWCFKFVDCQIVLDPFMGSGTTAIACEQLNRKWVGIEISEKYCEIAAKRIERENQQLKLFPPEAEEVKKPTQATLF